MDLSMFPPTCKQPGCGSPCQIAVSNSVKNPGREYWKCEQNKHFSCWVGMEAEQKPITGDNRKSAAKFNPLPVTTTSGHVGLNQNPLEVAYMLDATLKSAKVTMESLIHLIHNQQAGLPLPKPSQTNNIYRSAPEENKLYLCGSEKEME